MLVLERTDDFKDVFVADQPREYAFELFGVATRSAEEGAALVKSGDGGLKLLKDAPEVVDKLFDFCWPARECFAEGVVHLPDDSVVVFFAVFGDFLVFCEFLFDGVEEGFGGLVLSGGREPGQFFLHLNITRYKGDGNLQTMLRLTFAKNNQDHPYFIYPYCNIPSINRFILRGSCCRDPSV